MILGYQPEVHGRCGKPRASGDDPAVGGQPTEVVT